VVEKERNFVEEFPVQVGEEEGVGDFRF